MEDHKDIENDEKDYLASKSQNKSRGIDYLTEYPLRLPHNSREDLYAR